MSSGIVGRIQDIEREIARTQVNKATMSHLCSLRARLCQLRTQLLMPAAGAAAKGEGFDVEKQGDARVALIGFPSVGKSTILSTFTTTKSEAASYEFTTLTCIPGIIHHKETRIQLLDLPGIIEGASEGKGRGRQVIGVARSCDLILLVVDVGSGKAERQRELLEKELEPMNAQEKASEKEAKAEAMTLAPRSCPSWPIFATRMRGRRPCSSSNADAALIVAEISSCSKPYSSA